MVPARRFCTSEPVGRKRADAMCISRQCRFAATVTGGADVRPWGRVTTLSRRGTTRPAEAASGPPSWASR